jgi:hypothetical protein
MRRSARHRRGVLFDANPRFESLDSMVVARRLAIWGALALSLLIAAGATEAAAPTEYQVKAVFIFNFSRFVVWPQAAFTTLSQPFVIGVLGSDPFGPLLEEAVRGEQVDNHPMIIRRFRDVSEVSDCQILFIDRSQRPQLQRILLALDHRSILTVSDLDDASRRGVMIQLATQNRQIHLLINTTSARAAGLVISSNLLRLAEIVSTYGGG